MKDLGHLLALYVEVDRHLGSARTEAEANGDQEGATRARQKQRLNDQAYFLICWGQLEVEIDMACRSAIRSHQAKAAWADRRAWDLYNPDDKRLSGMAFEDRVAIVLDKRGSRGSPWALVRGYYALRNQIAHGTVQQDGIDVVEVCRHFYAIQGALTR